MLLTFWYVYFLSFFSSVVLNQVVHSLSHVRLFVTPWTTACQASLSFTISQSLLKFMSSESVILSNHLILCHSLLLLPSIFTSLRVFPVSQFFASGSQSIGVSASASVLPMNIQGWFPLGCTDLISLQSKGLSGVFSSTTVWRHKFFSSQPSLWSSSHICTWYPKLIYVSADIQTLRPVSILSFLYRALASQLPPAPRS